MDMSSLKPAPSKESVSAWEILRKCHLSAFVFFSLPYIATCESSSSSLFPARNSSAFFSPPQSVFLTSTPNLSGVHYGQTLRSSPDGQTSLEMAIKSVNDGFISQSAVLTGGDGHGPGIRTTKALASSLSSKTNAPIVESTHGSRHTVGEALQTKNRKAQSTTGGTETHNLQTLHFSSDSPTIATILSTMVQTGNTKVNTRSARMASEITSTFDKSKMINTRTASSYNHFTPTGSAIVSIEPTVLLQNSVSSKSATSSRTSEPARVLSILSSHEKFTDSVSRLPSNLHVTSNVFSTDDLSLAKDRSKSIFLSHYSTGTFAQVQSISSALSSSTVRETPQVSPSYSSAVVSQDSSSASTSTAVPRDSSFFTSTAVRIDLSSSIITAVHRDSPSFTSTAVPRVSTSFTSLAFESYTTSLSSEQNTLTSRATTASSFVTVTRITLVQPSFSSSVAVPEIPPLTCNVKNVTCVCFNCGQARANGQTCCTDLIDSKNIQQGIKLNMKDITVEGFYKKRTVVTQIIADVILDSCKVNSTLCFSNEQLSKALIKRKRRSMQTESLEDDSSSNIVRTQGDSESHDPMSQKLSSSVDKEALRFNMNPSKTNITSTDVIIYSISSKEGHPLVVQTAFYVTVTSFNNGTKRTRVVNGKGLLQILRDKRETLENRLNITIDSFSAWQSHDSHTKSMTFLTTLVPNPSPGSQNLQTSLSTPQGRLL